MKASQLPDSTLLLMSDRTAIPDYVAEVIQKSSVSLAPFCKPQQSLSIDDARSRQSDRSYPGVGLADLAQLLHLSLFEAEREGARPYPAAGGIYCVNLYLVVRKAEGLTPGVYFVRWSDRALELIGTEAATAEFFQQSVFQPNKDEIPVVGLLVADTRLSHYKYHDLATRMAYIEAGGLLQTLYLAGSRLGLPVCALGGIGDRAALSLTKLEPSANLLFTCGLAIGGRS